MRISASGSRRWRLGARDRPYSWRRRVRRNLSRLSPGNPLALGIAEGMARQAARHLVVVTPPCEGVAPLGAPSQRRYGAGPRFLTFRFALPPALRRQPLLGGRALRASGKPDGPPSASSWQGILVSPGAAPAPPGGLEGAFIPRPRAPRPILLA